jgi:glycosyltransferase involved in cell wall biosynthesis
LEAAACGCPVICNSIPVLIEVAGVFADFVETGNVECGVDALRRLYSVDHEENLLSRLEAGQRRAADFGASEIRRKWEALVAGLTTESNII